MYAVNSRVPRVCDDVIRSGLEEDSLRLPVSEGLERREALFCLLVQHPDFGLPVNSLGRVRF